jgi:gallate decarboxylase subunit D
MAHAPGTGEVATVSRFSITEKEGRFVLEAEVIEMGPDVLVAVWGGTRPHIGAVGMAQPRASLKYEETTSATGSVFTFPGHKEDMVAKNLSEEIARRVERQAVVVAGIHWDYLNDEEIQLIVGLTKRLTDRIIDRLAAKS